MNIDELEDTWFEYGVIGSSHQIAGVKQQNDPLDVSLEGAKPSYKATNASLPALP